MSESLLSEAAADYYQPGETARMLGISPSTLAYWASNGWIESTRTAGGHRRYTLAAIQRADEDHRAGRFGNLKGHIRRELALVTKNYPMWHCFIDSHERYWAVYLNPDKPAVFTSADIWSLREQIHYYQGGESDQRDTTVRSAAAADRGMLCEGNS